MNVYFAAKCPACSAPVVIDGEAGTCPNCGSRVGITRADDAVMAHGAANLEKALELLGVMTVDQVRSLFCACCGEPYAPGHGCCDPRPQSFMGHEWARVQRVLGA